MMFINHIYVLHRFYTVGYINAGKKRVFWGAELKLLYKTVQIL